LRLKRVEGQVKGIQKMMEEHRPCREVLTQLMAARSSLEQVGVNIFQREIQECLQGDRSAGGDQVRQLQDTVKLWSRLA
jgi:DNA-binding FrmR family transcriptional regulator